MTTVDKMKLAALDDLIEEITLDAYGDQEQLPAPALSEPRHQKRESKLDPGDCVDLAVLSVKEKAFPCRLVGGDLVTLRPSRPQVLAPGEIVTVRARKSWSFKGHPYLSGDIESVRIDPAALGLVPLRLTQFGIWTPEEEYWGEKGEAIDEWAKPIIARGARPSFRMEQVLPGVAPDDFDTDPISKSNDLKEYGDIEGALKILLDLCRADLRCLDAHAHLGNFEFDRSPKTALRHYEVGLRIGELSFPPGFDGLLPWRLVDNRPFLRCLHGYGLCLWRLDRFKEAEEIFERMLWLNPSDNQGVRFLIDDVRSGNAWRE